MYFGYYINLKWFYKIFIKKVVYKIIKNMNGVLEIKLYFTRLSEIFPYEAGLKFVFLVELN